MTNLEYQVMQEYLAWLKTIGIGTNETYATAGTGLSQNNSVIVK